MINHYRPTNRGTQPIRVLQGNIVKDFEAAISGSEIGLSTAIERHGFSPGINYVDHESPILNQAEPQKSQLPFVDLNKEVTIHATFLSFLWSVAFSTIVTFEETINKPALIRQHHQRHTIDQRQVNNAERIRTYALRLIRDFVPWDKDSLVNPELYQRQDRFYIEKANGVFLHATTFILTHELAHVVRGHIDELADADRTGTYMPPERSIIVEREADAQAAAVVMGRAKTSADRLNFGLGMIIGLTSLIFLRGSLTSSSHPDTDHRIETALKLIAGDELDHLWTIVALSFKVWDLHYGKGLHWPEDAQTPRALFYLIYNQLQTAKGS